MTAEMLIPPLARLIRWLCPTPEAPLQGFLLSIFESATLAINVRYPANHSRGLYRVRYSMGVHANKDTVYGDEFCGTGRSKI